MSDEMDEVSPDYNAPPFVTASCLLEWADGWGNDHFCTRGKDHVGAHRCSCDCEISRWTIDHHGEEIERKRLRELLRASQEET